MGYRRASLNFLGIGPAELIFILVIALIVFGPKRLPEIGRTLGKTMREFRNLSEDLTSQLREELETASEEMEAVSADVKDTFAAASEEMEAVSADMKGTLAAASEEMQAVSEDVKGTLEAASADVQPASEEAKSELVGFTPIRSAIEDVAGDGLQAVEQTGQDEADVGTLEREPDSERSS
jgi:TatA/E family protein of Tat protein translocase